MKGSKPMLSVTSRRLAALDGLEPDALAGKFMELFGFAPTTRNREAVRRRLAYRLQELASGGLSRRAEEFLDALADGDPLANLQCGAVTRLTRARGARYVREWQGRTYEVLVLGNGKFEYGGEVFGSLTAVAERITGTHWNGKRFFGVR